MLYCEMGSAEPEHFDDLAVLVSQLATLGVDARIDIASLPEKLSRANEFDVAGHLFEGDLARGDRVLLVGAQDLADACLVRLRRIARRGGAACIATGVLPTTQSIISLKSKLSYVFGQDPEVINLESARTGGEPHPRCPVFGVDLRGAARRQEQAGRRRQRLLLVGPDLGDPAQARALRTLGLSRRIEPVVLTDGKSKAEWQKAQGPDIPVYHYGEIPPAALALGVDLGVFFVDMKSSYRIRALIANLVASEAPLFDGSKGHALAKSNDAFIPGPCDLGSLSSYLGDEILPNLHAAGEKARRSRFARAVDAGTLLATFGLAAAQTSPPRATRGTAPTGPRRAVFVPTNGVGLGHAQRTSQIASQLDRSLVEPVFAAFPSCMKLLKSYGFDVMPMVSRSALHGEAHHNDLVNVSRLKGLSAGASSLVFDGGYVFDSICRSILENGLDGIWIRRGLWQAGQDNAISLDREKVFSRVIVPTEAFDELNEDYSTGSHVTAVGPIVQRIDHMPAEREELRSRVARTFGRDFRRLAVTMLGGGVAADRTAQTNAACASMERRSDTLHLLVVWPTAMVEPAWFTWENTRVVQTHHAGALVAASDLYVSAVGYNSFHEVIYNRIPAIFMPQMNAFMDDQRARARAAVDRGLASIVEPHEIMTLDRLVCEYLDEGLGAEIRSRLTGLNLPEPGNAAAARIIEEVTHG